MSLQSLSPPEEERRFPWRYAGISLLAILAVTCILFIASEYKPAPETTTSTIESTSTTTTSTTSSTTSSTSSSTEESTTSTTTLAVVCSKNSDCGLEREEKVCYLHNVYLKKITPICKKPGSVESYCVSQESWVTGSIVAEPIPLETCSNGCVNGTCVKRSSIP